jgi:hypothetical protein
MPRERGATQRHAPARSAVRAQQSRNPSQVLVLPVSVGTVEPLPLPVNLSFHRVRPHDVTVVHARGEPEPCLAVSATTDA